MTTKQKPRDTYYFSPEREKRVAAALRENLRKRKAPTETTTSTQDKE